MWVCIALLFLSYLQYNSAEGDGLAACIPGTPARRAFTLNPQGLAEARSILRRRRQVDPQIEPEQQESAASNIAGQQARAGDLAGALKTVRGVHMDSDTGLLYYGLSYSLAARGNWALAIKGKVEAGRRLRPLPWPTPRSPRARAYALLGAAPAK